jgi:hypothetical protein
MRRVLNGKINGGELGTTLVKLAKIIGSGITSETKYVGPAKTILFTFEINTVSEKFTQHLQDISMFSEEYRESNKARQADEYETDYAKVFDLITPFIMESLGHDDHLRLIFEGNRKHIRELFISDPDFTVADFANVLDFYTEKEMVIEIYHIIRNQRKLILGGVNKGKNEENEQASSPVYNKNERGGVQTDVQIVKAIENQPHVRNSKSVSKQWPRMDEIFGVKDMRLLKEPYRQLHRDMTYQEERKLLELFLNEGDLIAREVLFRFKSGMVFSKVIALINKYPYLMPEKNDLIQAGSLGLLEAISSFDLSFTNRLSTYVSFRITEKLIDYMDNEMRLVKFSENANEGLRALYKVEQRFTRKFGQQAPHYKDLVQMDADFGNKIK